MKFDDYILHSKFHKHLSSVKEATPLPPNNPPPVKYDNQFQHFPENINDHKQDYIMDTITDTQGLERAYSQGDYYIHGNTLYVAGSWTGKDWYDDFTKVPFWGDLREATRYKAAEGALKANPQVKRVIGHSLGGSVALELEKNYDQVKFTRTYGAPVFDWTEHEHNPMVDRYRNLLDPFSVLDNAANISIKWNPFDSYSLTHDYSNIADNFTSVEKRPVSSENPDGTISLIG